MSNLADKAAGNGKFQPVIASREGMQQSRADEKITACWPQD